MKFGVDRLLRHQRGFTAVEVLIAIAIAGIIGGVVITAVFQVVTTSLDSSARMTAIKEIENSIRWITDDALMAQTISSIGPGGFPLTLNWVEWDMASNQHVTHSVVYDLQGNELTQSASVNGGPPVASVLIHHLDVDTLMTNCNFFSGVLTIKMTAEVKGYRTAAETRTFHIYPRSAPQ
jgi:prepilin-type N-terminal cleavage/methylation domain-containing protein